MPTARMAQTTTVMDGKIYVLGGVDVESFAADYLKTLEAYDPASNSWETLGTMPTGRGYMASSVVAGKLYAIAGATNFRTPSDAVEVYDPATDSWSQLAALPVGLYYPASAVGGNKIYVTGGIGFDDQSSLKTRSETQVYDPLSDTWTIAEPLQLARNRHVSETVGRYIYVIAGATEVGHPHGTLDGVERLQVDAAFTINPGLNDAWFNPLTDGQGFLIMVFPDTGLMFVAWFTYDVERPPPDVTALLGEPGHRWLTALGPFEGDTATLDVYLTQGGVFDMAEPPAVTGDPSGTLTIVWSDCENGVLTYDIDPPGVMGEIPIKRIVADNVALCQALAEQ